MVNISSLEKLIQFINKNNLKFMKKWSTRLCSQSSNSGRKYLIMKKKIRSILNLISGNDIVEMLKSVLYRKEREELSLEAKEIIALKNLSNCYSNTDLKERWRLARELKNSGLSRPKLRGYGFSISRGLWKNCTNNCARNKGGGKPISKALREALKSYLIENSYAASNRLVVNKNSDDEHFRKEVPARYLEKNVIELYKNFPHSNQISRTTFFKYVHLSGQYKKPIRMTDLCDYCEKAKTLKRSLIPKLARLGLKCEDKFDIELIKRFLDSQKSQNENNRVPLNLIDDINKDVKAYDTILNHQNIARAQRMAYNRDRSDPNLLRGKILIEVDFKQKITLGFGPRQINTEFYDRRNKQRTCLGFGVYYFDRVEEKIKIINFDIIASDGSQDAQAAVRGFRLLRRREFFKEIDKRDTISEYIVWMDCGRHFRNSLVVGYLFRELAEEGIRVNLNFFCEKHGKNARDAHFSMVSRFIEQESLQRRLICSEDVVNAIVKGQKQANENRGLQRKKLAKGNDHIRSEAMALTYNVMVNYKKNYPELKPLSIKNMLSFYNFRSFIVETNQVEIFTSILSNRDELLKLTTTQHEIMKPIFIVEKEDILYDQETIKLSCMEAKQNRINNHLDNLKNEVPNHVSNVSNETKTVPKETSQSVICPVYCRKSPIGKKPVCASCQADCAFSIYRLVRGEYGSKVVQEELKNHLHPSFREIPFECGKTDNKKNSRPRTNKEACEELANHYVFAHGLVKPILNDLYEQKNMDHSQSDYSSLDSILEYVSKSLN